METTSSIGATASLMTPRASRRSSSRSRGLSIPEFSLALPIALLLREIRESANSPKTNASDHLFEHRLVHGEFVLGRYEHHVKEALIIRTSDDPYDLGRGIGIIFSDHDSAHTRLIAH